MQSRKSFFGGLEGEGIASRHSPAPYSAGLIA